MSFVIISFFNNWEIIRKEIHRWSAINYSATDARVLELLRVYRIYKELKRCTAHLSQANNLKSILFNSAIQKLMAGCVNNCPGFSWIYEN